MGFILDTPDQIQAYRMLVLFHGLKLELQGIKVNRNTSILKILKKMGYIGTRQKILDQLAKELGKEVN
jgi:hypothetical protein